MRPGSHNGRAVRIDDDKAETRSVLLADPAVVAAIAAEVAKAPPLNAGQADMLRRLGFPAAATEQKASA